MKTLRSLIVVLLALIWFLPTYLIVVNAFTPNDAYT